MESKTPDGAHQTNYKAQENKKITITLSRDNLINAVVVLQLVLLVVFGWQLFSLKSQLEGDGTLAKGGGAPTVAAPSAPSAAAPPSGAPADVTVTSDDHIRGNKNAKVAIIEYSDFECPFCAKAFPTINQVLDTYGDDVMLVYRHFPLSFHPQAQKAAEASECSADQGKFWEYHDKIFQEQSKLSGGVSQMKTWAKEIGLNSSEFDSCLDSGEKAGDVSSDQSSGSQYGVTGTPGFLINGISVTGAQPFSAFQQIIDSELAKS